MQGESRSGISTCSGNVRTDFIIIRKTVNNILNISQTKGGNRRNSNYFGRDFFMTINKINYSGIPYN